VILDGYIRVEPLYYERLCPQSGNCGPTEGDVYLASSKAVAGARIRLYLPSDEGFAAVSCAIDEDGSSKCPKYGDGQEASLTGMIIRNKVPDLVVGSSSGPPVTKTWKYEYIFVIE
jgi:hypothetical protein